ncbi:hypothetical protein AB0F15_38020 [Amycolatopsis sp. NPDC026612]|uniref:hypothetical protein n=1 Tax=Amycolatopsis sp. NPDC026612 TaxID=3155466 RepID=UPI0033E6F952
MLIATGTTSYPHRPDLGGRPELADEVERVKAMLTAADGGFGYETAPGFKTGMRAGELKQRIRATVARGDFGADDFLIFYYTGHGEIDESGEFVLPLSDTTDDLVGTGLSVSELARWFLVETRVQKLLVILDTCYAGAAGKDFAKHSIDALGRLRGVAQRPHFAIISATRPLQQALPGTFTQAFERAVLHRASGGHEPRFLPLDAVVDLINVDPGKAPSQHAQLLSSGEAVAGFLPNPRFNTWLRGLDLRMQLDHEQRKKREREFVDHVMPRAQGLDTPQDGVWLFTGRVAALRELSDWLHDVVGDGESRVVTGDPGSGKSALLARLTVLARPEHRQKIPNLDQLPADTIPPRGSIDVFIHARGLTADQVLAGLCAEAGVEATTPGELLAALGERSRPFVAVIDALDEATDPDQLAARVLATLLRGAPHSQLRLILGTRRHLVDRLGGHPKVLNLDSEVYADPASVTAYVRRCLLDLVPGSPYVDQAPDLVDAVSQAVGDAAGKSFLVALITGRSLALQQRIPNPYDARWRARLPRMASEAMRLDLELRLGTQAPQARDLMMPLAYALGSGLPWEDIWAPLASAIAERVYTLSDLEWLIRQAGFYIVEALVANRSVYRLYHEALAEYLRSWGDETEIQRKIVEFWIGRTPSRNGRPDWALASSYARRHLATHATAAGVFDSLVVDPAYLLHADRSPLLAAMASARSPEAVAAAQAYRRTLKHLRDKPPEEHGAYLELAARCHRSSLLAEATAKAFPARPWRTVWAQWVRRSRTSVVHDHTDRVTSIATGEAYDHPVVVSGSMDGTVRVWDLATGISQDAIYRAHDGAVRAVDLFHRDGESFIASGGDDMTVRLWHLESGRPLGEPLLGHRHHVRGIAAGEIDNRPVVVSSSYDYTIRIWDVLGRTALGQPLTGHSDNITGVALVDSGWHPLVISGSLDGTICAWDVTTQKRVMKRRNWNGLPIYAMSVLQHGDAVTLTVASSDGSVCAMDLVTGELVGTVVDCRFNPVHAIASAEINGSLIAVCGHNDRTVRSWDLTSGSPFREPFTGHAKSIHAVAVGQLDGQPLAISGGDDGAVQVHDLGSRGVDATAIGAHLRGIRCVEIGRLRDRTVVVSGSDDRTIRLWDLRTGDPIGQPMSGHTASVRALATYGSGIDGPVVLVSGSDDGTVRVWDLEAGVQLRTLPFVHGIPVRAVAAVDVDGNLAVASGAQDDSVMVWDFETGRRLASVLVGYLYPVLVVAIGRARGRVATLKSYWGTEGTPVPLWGPIRGAFSAKQSQEDSDRLITSLVSVRGKSVVASGDDEGTLRMWALGDGRRGLFGLRRGTSLRLISEVGGDSPITAIAHSAEHGLAVARLHVVEVAADRGARRVIHLDAEIRDLAFTDFGSLVVGTAQGVVVLDI